MYFVYCPSCAPTWFQFAGPSVRDSWLAGHRIARSHHFGTKAIDVETAT